MQNREKSLMVACLTTSLKDQSLLTLGRGYLLTPYPALIMTDPERLMVKSEESCQLSAISD